MNLYERETKPFKKKRIIGIVLVVIGALIPISLGIWLAVVGEENMFEYNGAPFLVWSDFALYCIIGLIPAGIGTWFFIIAANNGIAEIRSRICQNCYDAWVEKTGNTKKVGSPRRVSGYRIETSEYSNDVTVTTEYSGGFYIWHECK